LDTVDRERLYLAGPMRGIAYFNFAAFTAAAEDLRERGYFVFSPAERDIEHGLILRDCLADDLIWICRNATAVVVLPGWEGSKGAQAEVHTARALGIPVLTLDEALRAW
jgi:Domain of unknown function (DUF4406)